MVETSWLPMVSGSVGIINHHITTLNQPFNHHSQPHFLHSTASLSLPFAASRCPGTIVLRPGSIRDGTETLGQEQGPSEANQQEQAGLGAAQESHMYGLIWFYMVKLMDGSQNNGFIWFYGDYSGK